MRLPGHRHLFMICVGLAAGAASAVTGCGPSSSDGGTAGQGGLSGSGSAGTTGNAGAAGSAVGGSGTTGAGGMAGTTAGSGGRGGNAGNSGSLGSAGSTGSSGTGGVAGAAGVGGAGGGAGRGGAGGQGAGGGAGRGGAGGQGAGGMDGGAGSGSGGAAGGGNGGTAGATNPPPPLTGTTVSGTVKVTRGTRMGHLPAAFAGFSFEKSHMSDGFFVPTHAALVAMFKLLGPGVVRIGADDVNNSVWVPVRHLRRTRHHLAQRRHRRGRRARAVPDRHGMEDDLRRQHARQLHHADRGDRASIRRAQAGGQPAGRRGRQRAEPLQRVEHPEHLAFVRAGHSQQLREHARRRPRDLRGHQLRDQLHQRRGQHHRPRDASLLSRPGRDLDGHAWPT